MEQYIGFNLSGCEYTIPILKVREIINMPEITRMPQTSHFIEGVTNLRGNVIPIVNLKRLVNLPEDGGGNKVIVVASGSVVFGILVDGITGVINIDPATIEPPEGFLPDHAEQIEGVAKLPDRLVVLLNPKKLVPFEDMSIFDDVVLDVKESESGDTVEVVKKVQGLGGEVQVKEIHNAREYFSKMGMTADDPRNLVFDDMVSFMEAISGGDYENADAAIQNIIKKGQGDIFKEVGKITRKLHDAIRGFKDALDPKLKDMANVEMPNAIDRLQFVIDQTEAAANKTMTIVEKYMLEMDTLADHIRNLKGPDESIEYMKKFKNSMEDDLTELITTQSYQDITGQTIKKVITLVGEIEEELVRLISTFGVKVEPVAAGVQAGAEQVSQSDVDDLLKDFGF